MRVLFIVKKREDYCPAESHNHHGYCDRLGGLFNSARFVVDMLNENHVTARLVQVTDNNDIDHEVHNFNPDLVIIEALWVVPEKFEVLTRLHPKVKWIVRVHSEIPFLAMEGIAVEWIAGYMAFPRVSVAGNSVRSTEDIRAIVRQKFGEFVADAKVHFLPNWYPSEDRREHEVDPYHLNIGCFGAIRPFKNQLIQGLAAIEFAEKCHEVLRFHVNATRCEQHGENVLKNLRALFKGTGNYLIEHEWESHEQFLRTMAGMDLSMAVSFSETFNITSADAVTSNVPIVVSPEVSWASPACYADPTSSQSILDTMLKVTSAPTKWFTIGTNLRRLKKFDRDSSATWLRFLR